MPLPTKKRVIVVGGGLAGLACTIKLAEEGVNVDLISMVPVKRSHSVCAQGGINACNDIARQQGIAKSGYRLIVNCNPDSGQEVYHLHVHLLGGRSLGPLVQRP